MSTNRTVICINTYKRIIVPATYRACSVCGVYNDPKEFNTHNDPNAAPTRINCTSCYNLSSREMAKLKQKTQNKKLALNSKYNKEVNKLVNFNADMGSSISVEELISKLQALPVGSRVIVVDQDGYYCQRQYGNIFETPEKVIETEVDNLYIIGQGGSSDYC